MNLYTRAWRWLAWKLPPSLRRILPGYGHLAGFVLSYVSIDDGTERVIFLQDSLYAEGPWFKALIRAGGVHASFRLVLGEELPPEVAERFATPENPTPDLNQVASSVVMLGQMVGVDVQQLFPVDGLSHLMNFHGPGHDSRINKS